MYLDIQTSDSIKKRKNRNYYGILKEHLSKNPSKDYSKLTSMLKEKRISRMNTKPKKEISTVKKLTP